MADETTTDRQWYDEFTLSLRYRDVPGTRIGDAVAQVESHCSDSGESPAAAFGDPRAYADSLEFPRDDAAGAGHWLPVLGPIVAFLVALQLGIPIPRAAVEGTTVPVTWGSLGAIVVIVLMMAMLWFRTRLVLENRLVGGVTIIGGTVLAVLSAALLRESAFDAPVLVMTVLVVALVAYAAVGMWRQRTTLNDPIVDPRG